MLASREEPLAYVGERKAFGKTIDQFQALQFKLAETEIELQAARTFLRQAAWKLDHKTPDAPKFCAMAKLYVTDAAFEVANTCLQMHGGMGVTWELDVAHYFKRLTVINALFGNADGVDLLASTDVLLDGQVLYLSEPGLLAEVDQTQAEDGPELGGQAWQSIGQVTVGDGSDRIEISVQNAASGIFAADAVRLARERFPGLELACAELDIDDLAHLSQQRDRLAQQFGGAVKEALDRRFLGPDHRIATSRRVGQRRVRAFRLEGFQDALVDGFVLQDIAVFVGKDRCIEIRIGAAVDFDMNLA